MKNDFTKKVLETVIKIPKGELMTYHQVAKNAGSSRAYRAVGSILNRNFRDIEWQLPLETVEPVPCHRVIRSDGFVGNYARGTKEKIKILESEGHVVVGGRIKIAKLMENK